MSDFDYSAEKFELIFRKIVQDRAGHLKEASTPACYLVMGQPGSGKTALIHKISRSMRNNVLICNADDLRNYHPHFEEIVRDHESDLPNLTWAFANDMNRRLIEYGAGRKVNLVIETTGQNRQVVLDTLNYLPTRSPTAGRNDQDNALHQTPQLALFQQDQVRGKFCTETGDRQS